MPIGKMILRSAVLLVVLIVLGMVVLYLIASGKADFSVAGGFASNGYADHSPGGYSLTRP